MGPRLDPYGGNEPLICRFCATKAHWLLHSIERFLALCDPCAASLLFSSTEMSALIAHLPSEEKDGVVYRLMQARRAS
jgi:hypothetical protein